MTPRPHILVVGAGYVGLATAVFLADQGLPVTVAEKNPETVDLLKRGRLHFREPRLAARLKDVIKQRSLSITPPEEKPFQQADIIFIAIDSADRTTGLMRLDPFDEIARWIGSVKRKSIPTVVLKSTNVLGFARKVRVLFDRTPHGRAVKLVVNPEFLREGLAYEDTANPFRIVIGSREKRDAARLVMLFRSIYPKSLPIVHTDWESAELIKLSSNVYLAYRLAFIHEIAEYARRENLDLESIRRGIGLDSRIGLDYFHPGLGFGGSCLPKDCRLINSDEAAPDFLFESARTAMLINDRLLDNLIARLHEKLGSLDGKKIALLGAAFKADVDDTRDSRAVTLACMLQQHKVKLAVFDPYLKGLATISETAIPLTDSLDDTLTGAAAIIIGAPHKRFALLKPMQVARLVRKKLIVDYFGVLNRGGWTEAGFEIVS